MTRALPPARLSELRTKYQHIIELRRSRERGDPPPAAAVFRSLAAAFPGALRELDVTPMAVLESRLLAIDRALASGDPDDWMVIQVSYHALLRFALSRKRGIAIEPADPAIVGIDAEFVAALDRPLDGRLVPIVIAALARALGVPPHAIRAALLHSSAAQSP